MEVADEQRRRGDRDASRGRPRASATWREDAAAEAGDGREDPRRTLSGISAMSATVFLSMGHSLGRRGPSGQSIRCAVVIDGVYGRQAATHFLLVVEHGTFTEAARRARLACSRR